MSAALTADAWQSIQELLDCALDLPVAERAVFLDQSCAGNTEQRATLERVLRACAASAGFLEDESALVFAAPIAAALNDRDEAIEGLRVGPYRIVREAGHGGMGVVYVAERDDDQYRRQVALKLVRGRAWARADDYLMRHFRAERQILATLDHPGIARLLDGGVTADGIPWFAMEYVEGTPITRYCDEHGLTIAERLALFCDACNAVAFAHRNLVVHRDLKPSNILVTAERAVKLLDFGIAKLLAPEGDAAPVTQTVRALTPEYASPEQIRGERVTPASDVYSLGVLLYELLAGQRPHDASGSHVAVVRAILEEQPVLPSSTLSPKAASARCTTPDRLRRAVRGDLDAIVMTAMRREPERRYAAADQLMTDVRRHVDGLPVSARRDGWAYRTGKFVRRHRTAVGLTAVLGALLVGFGAVTAVQSARIRAQAERIALERDRAQQVSAFLTSLFKSADPIAGDGPRTPVRAVLDSGAARIDRELADQPELRAELLRVMAVSYLNLDLPAEARRLLERAFKIRSQATNAGVPQEVSVAHNLAQVLQEQGEYQHAEALYREVLEWRRRVLPKNHHLVARTLSTLATVVSAQGRYGEAEALAREALVMDRAQRPVDPRMLSQSLNNLGNIMFKQRQYVAAESLHREAYQLRRSAAGEEHAETANSLVNLAAALGAQERYAEAESLFERALAIKRQKLGPHHSDVATDEAGFAKLLHAKGDYAKAEALYRQSIATHRLTRREVHPRTAIALLGLGALLLERGAPAEAEPHLREALAMFSAAHHARHPHVADAQLALGECLLRMAHYAEAERLLGESLATLSAVRGKQDEQTRRARQAVADLRHRWAHAAF